MASPFSGSHYLVVAQLRMQQTRPITLHIKRMRQQHGHTVASSEMKASATHAKISAQLLAAIAEEKVSINAVIVDKRCIVRPPADPEALYRAAIARAVYHAVSIHPQLDVCLDRRYTTQHQRDRLERTIREQISTIPQAVVLIRQEDSMRYKELQAVDFIAWAFFQKYERGDDQFFQIIAERVDAEEVIAQPLW